MSLCVVYNIPSVSVSHCSLLSLHHRMFFFLRNRAFKMGLNVRRCGEKLPVFAS